MVAINNKRPLTVGRFNELLRYEPESGHFFWRVARGRRAAGARAGDFKRTGYREIRVDGFCYLEHRLAWFVLHGEWPTNQIDHINADRLDNRIANLRLATPSQNQANRRINPKSKSGLKGVYFCKTAKAWVAYIRVNGRGHTIGYFDNPSMASRAYIKRARHEFGEFARTS